MRNDSKLLRLLMVSPWSLLFFLIVPVLVILSLKLNVQVPLVGNPQALTVNNLCFALLCFCRFVRYAAGYLKTIRYGADTGRPGKGSQIDAPARDARGRLRDAGYIFTDDGGYGERRDLGYLGTTVIYAGLCILLTVGIANNLRHFSGTLLDGVGLATDLSKKESYKRLSMGPYATGMNSLPKMRIVRQLPPDAVYPRGTTEITLISEDGKVRTELLKPGTPVRYGSFDISMTKLVFEPQIVIKGRDSKVLFDALVRLDPLVQKRGDFSFYGLFVGQTVHGGVYYQPEKSRLKVVISRGDKRVVSDMVFQVDQQVEQGEYILSCAKMGQWSEIHVIRHRNMGLIAVGGVLTLIGLLVRVVVPARRVWLEETLSGCTVYATDGEAVKQLKV